MIRNRIAECRAPNHRDLIEPVRYVVIHRTSLSVRESKNPRPVPDEELDVVQMADAFCRGSMATYTAGLFPYHVMIRRDGVAEQAIPLDTAGAHAQRYNVNTLAVAYIGEHDCNAKQRETLEQVVTALCLHTRTFAIVGHSDLPGSSRDPAKVCPHLSFPMDAVRRGVASRLPERWQQMPRNRIDLILSAEGYQLSREADTNAAQTVGA